MEYSGEGSQCVHQNPEEWSSPLGECGLTTDGKPRTGRAGDTVRSRPGASSQERPFDMWLRKQLHAMYDEIASEPLPDDLLKLIDRDAADTVKAKK